MAYNMETLIPYIPHADYDKIATEFLETYFPEALHKPQSVPILDIARSEMGLDVKFICLSEEQDIYGMTIFSDGIVEVYIPEEGVYEEKVVKKKTVLIDPEAVKKTNIGCLNNTIAHECVHWYKHRMYYRMQKYTLPKMAKYCKCRLSNLAFTTDDEKIMEMQAVGIAPRILMPKASFLDVVKHYDLVSAQESWRAISEIAKFFNVSKQSAIIRLQECGII